MTGTPTVYEVMNGLFNALNVMGNEKATKEAAVRAFNSTHRTLQQSFMRVVIIPILKHLAQQHEVGYFDQRNADAAKLASRMLKDLTDDDLFLPFV